jgi:hypothetical protein
MADLRLKPLPVLVILSDEELERFGQEYAALSPHDLTMSFHSYCAGKALADRKVRRDRIKVGIMAFERKRAAAVCRDLAQRMNE